MTTTDTGEPESSFSILGRGHRVQSRSAIQREVAAKRWGGRGAAEAASAAILLTTEADQFFLTLLLAATSPMYS
jgi:hypothetical protein